jgi:dTDP-4-dehydrorhamnose reductase
MSKPAILVTGSAGQLGNEIKVLSGQYPSFTFIFNTKRDLPVQDTQFVQNYIREIRPAFCINCAAYTAVDKAEKDEESAFMINAVAVGAMAKVCRETGTKFIHISTDYVFDGTSQTPYTEDTPPGPANVYGASKLKGEHLARYFNEQSIIIRTAWLYSAFGNNFVKTMLRLMKEKPEINVVNDQIGAPTYAADLAKCILDIVNSADGRRQTANTADSRLPIADWTPGIYHYSNRGRISWYDFAVAIRELSGSICKVKPIPTLLYPTPAKRPAFSLLDTRKIQKTFNCTIPDWKVSLQDCLKRLMA